MKKRLIAAEAIQQGDALTCVEVKAGPDGTGFDFRIGVIRPGLRDYDVGPIGFARADHAAGAVMGVDSDPAGLVEAGSFRVEGKPWSARATSTPLADLLAVRERIHRP